MKQSYFRNILWDIQGKLCGAECIHFYSDFLLSRNRAIFLLLLNSESVIPCMHLLLISAAIYKEIGVKFF